VREELHVDFETDDGLVLGEDFGRESCYGRHGSSLAIALLKLTLQALID